MDNKSDHLNEDNKIDFNDEYFQLELDKFKDYLKSDTRRYINSQLLNLSYIGE